MQIQGFDAYGSYYRQQALPKIQQVSVEEARRQELEKQQAQNQQLLPKNTPQNESIAAPDNRSRTADLENISLTFNAGETYDYIGRDVSVDNLDMENAISDMKKDKVLEQYQYFVRPQDAEQQVAFRSEDGIVIQK